MSFNTVDRRRLAKVIKFLEESLLSEGIIPPAPSASPVRSKLSLKPKLVQHREPAANQPMRAPVARKGNGYR